MTVTIIDCINFGAVTSENFSLHINLITILQCTQHGHMIEKNCFPNLLLITSLHPQKSVILHMKLLAFGALAKPMLCSSSFSEAFPMQFSGILLVM